MPPRAANSHSASVGSRTGKPHFRDSHSQYSTASIQLTEVTGSSQQNVSKHLGILHGANMVDRRKEGNRTVYEISDPMVFELCELVCGNVQRQVDELQRILEGE